MYVNGQGVEQDHAEAMRLWQLAADRKWKGADSNLNILQQNNTLRQTIPPPPPGTAAIVVGLTSVAGQLLNNRTGTVVIPAGGISSIKPGRVAVLFDGESVPRSFKQMNLHVDRAATKGVDPNVLGSVLGPQSGPIRSFETELATIQKRKSLAMKAKLAAYLQDAAGGSGGGSDGSGGGSAAMHTCPRCVKNEDTAFLFGRSGLLCCKCGQSYCGACSKDLEVRGQSGSDFDKCVACHAAFPETDAEVFWQLGTLVLDGSKRQQERYTAAAQLQIGHMYVTMRAPPPLNPLPNGGHTGPLARLQPPLFSSETSVISVYPADICVVLMPSSGTMKERAQKGWIKRKP